MVTLGLYRGYNGVTLGFYGGYNGIMEKKVETTIWGLGCKAKGGGKPFLT